MNGARNGLARLGLENPESHIEGWKLIRLRHTKKDECCMRNTNSNIYQFLQEHKVMGQIRYNLLNLGRVYLLSLYRAER